VGRVVKVKFNTISQLHVSDTRFPSKYCIARRAVGLFFLTRYSNGNFGISYSFVMSLPKSQCEFVFLHDLQFLGAFACLTKGA
jgi:hypothetical protein